MNGTFRIFRLFAHWGAQLQLAQVAGWWCAAPAKEWPPSGWHGRHAPHGVHSLGLAQQEPPLRTHWVCMAAWVGPQPKVGATMWTWPLHRCAKSALHMAVHADINLSECTLCVPRCCFAFGLGPWAPFWPTANVLGFWGGRHASQVAHMAEECTGGGL